MKRDFNKNSHKSTAFLFNNEKFCYAGIGSVRYSFSMSKLLFIEGMVFIKQNAPQIAGRSICVKGTLHKKCLKLCSVVGLHFTG